MLRTATALFFLMLCNSSFAQNEDCTNAIPLICDSVYHFDNVSGFGDKQEISGNELGNEHFFTEEHNTAWHIIEPQANGILTMELIPDHISDDWDFLIFKGETERTCEVIAKKSILPLRSNLARNDMKLGGLTGLSNSAKNNFEPAGLNSNFSKYLEVKKGEKYFLVLDNNSVAGHGYKITVNLKKEKAIAEVKKADSVTTKVKSPLQKEMEWVNTKSGIPSTKYSFDMVESKTEKPLACSVKVVVEKGFGQDSIIEFSNQSTVSFQIEQSTNFSVNVSKPGYMFLSTNYRSPRNDSTLHYKFELPQAKAGALISLPDINFRENTTHLLTTSINALQQIYDFMNSNPDAVIEIRGHVNAPGYENSGKVKRFSEKRAEEVKSFLVDMGVEGSRMKTSGMGNGFMIYPAPANYDQEKANRRVEIKILKN